MSAGFYLKLFNDAVHAWLWSADSLRILSIWVSSRWPCWQPPIVQTVHHSWGGRCQSNVTAKNTLSALLKRKKINKSKGAALFKAVNEVDAVKSCVRCSNIYKSKGALKLVICILGWVHFGVSTEWQNVVLTLQVYAAFSASFGFFVSFFALIIAPFTLWFSWKGSSTIKVWVLSKTSNMRECYK